MILCDTTTFWSVVRPIGQSEMFQMFGWTIRNVSNAWLDNNKCFKCLVGQQLMFQMFGWTIRNVSNAWLDNNKCFKCLVGQ
jgi:hypothetical protein